MGKLENIIARNQAPKRMPEKVLVSMFIGIVVLLILALAVFTDLGMPPGYVERGSGAAPGSGDHAGSSETRAPGKRVDGVRLGASPRRAAPPSSPTAQPASSTTPPGK